ncbi:MAG: cysteine peptidase family C39 domain-containing protein [bacterium]|nr:cysteine peptidase family C39 domain-containing protein [bacterium]
MKIISLPQLLQTYEYDCGAQALQAVLIYYGINVKGGDVMKMVNTSKRGTLTKGITDAAKKYGLKSVVRKMSISDIRMYIDKKIPVLLQLQAWTGKKNVDWKDNWTDSHFVVAIGYAKNRIIFEDPYSINRVFLTTEELQARWHAKDDGEKLLHYGIAIFGKKPNFQRDLIVHMD